MDDASASQPAGQFTSSQPPDWLQETVLPWYSAENPLGNTVKEQFVPLSTADIGVKAMTNPKTVFTGIDDCVLALEMVKLAIVTRLYLAGNNHNNKHHSEKYDTFTTMVAKEWD